MFLYLFYFLFLTISYHIIYRMEVSFFVRCKEFCTSFPYEKNGNETIFIAVSTVPCGNRTHNCPLGGGCYIHLTKETYIKIRLDKQIFTLWNYTIKENVRSIYSGKLIKP